MSKAFVSEDTGIDPGPLLPARPDEPQPITRAGLRRLTGERESLAKDAPRRLVLDRILATVQVVEPELVEGRASFGCTIAIEDERGARREYTLVGPDEIDPRAGRVSTQSPIGRALIGKRAGDSAEVERAGRIDEVLVLDVRVDER